MESRETLATLGTQDTGRRQTKEEKIQHRKPNRRATRTPPKTGTNPCFFHILEIHIKMKFYIIVIL